MISSKKFAALVPYAFVYVLFLPLTYFHYSFQMREELQDRHQAMVNDVNGYTNCSKYLHSLHLSVFLL